jgi:hypothetical protein
LLAKIRMKKYDVEIKWTKLAMTEFKNLIKISKVKKKMNLAISLIMRIIILF